MAQNKDNDYNHLTQDEREYLFVERSKGKSFRKIAKEMGTGRSHTTLSRERKRNSIDKWRDVIKYSPSKAQEKYENRRIKANQNHIILRKEDKMRERLIWLLEDKGKSRWVDAIVWRLKLEWYRSVSTSSVYRFIRYDKPWLQAYLLHWKKWYRTRWKWNKRKKMYTDVPNIAETPIEAKNRLERGHREWDTVVSWRISKGGIVSMYDRYSRYYIIKKVGNLKSWTVKIALEAMMAWETVKTAVFDNGAEFWNISELPFQCYRADPYASSQRWGNERHNWFFRRDVPKWSDISDYSEEEIQMIQDKINHMPRKILGYRTPYEVYHEKELKYL